LAGTAVFARSNTGPGVFAESNFGTALYARNNAIGGWAGEVYGNVQVHGVLQKVPDGRAAIWEGWAEWVATDPSARCAMTA
jgi:hypothetical protein